MPIIIAIVIFILGGICIAFDVSLGGALLIILGVILAIILITLLFTASTKVIKSEKKQNIILIITLVLIVALCLFVFVKCSGGILSGCSDDDDSWEKCLKCGGDGKVVNNYGVDYKCPRCNGVGYIP